MNRRALATLIGLLVPVVAHTREQELLQQKVDELNTHARRLLGLSINALALLPEISQESYIPLRQLQLSGEISFVEELEKGSFVTVDVIQGLPDGSESDHRFMKITLLPLGESLQRSLHHLNPAV
jgi:hypothetical protein